MRSQPNYFFVIVFVVVNIVFVVLVVVAVLLDSTRPNLAIVLSAGVEVPEIAKYFLATLAIIGYSAMPFCSSTIQIGIHPTST